MEEKKYLMKLEEGLEVVTARLSALQNGITSMLAGLEREHIEKQALNSIECIGFCVSDIRELAERVLTGDEREQDKE